MKNKGASFSDVIPLRVKLEPQVLNSRKRTERWQHRWMMLANIILTNGYTDPIPLQNLGSYQPENRLDEM